MTTTPDLLAPASAHATEASAPEPTQTPEAAPQAPAAEGAEPSPSTGLLAEACARGDVALFHQRSTGTLRRLPYLAPESAAREAAEWFAMRRDEGASVAAIAGASGISKATVRRALAALALTDEVEDGDLDGVYEPGVVAVIVSGGTEDEQ